MLTRTESDSMQNFKVCPGEDSCIEENPIGIGRMRVCGRKEERGQACHIIFELIHVLN